MPRRRPHLLPTTLLILIGSAPAQARPNQTDKTSAPASVDPARVLDVQTLPARSKKLIPASARRYAHAKRLLGQGKPAQALEALKGSKGDLLADREALLRGDALLALGSKKQAKQAYLRALEKAQIKSVSIGAARGLVNVLGQLDERDLQLLYLDALLAERGIPRRPSLVYQRAQVLDALGRRDEAASAYWRILLDFPKASVASHASRALERLKRKGVDIPATNARLELARIRNLVSSSAYRDAERAMEALANKVPALREEIELERAHMYRRRRLKGEERRVLEGLLKGGLSGRTEAKVLARLGRLAMSRDEDDKAIAYFDRLREKYPADRETVEAQYLAGWIPYNAGNYDEATRRMLEFADEHPRSKRRTEALWFAGWSAYLAKKDGRARRSFEQLLEEHPESSLAPHARYWIGRIHHRNKALDRAKQEYREVLKLAPLSYYGFWSMERLAELGEETVLTPPPPVAPPARIRRVVEMLGSSRPILIDRAIALHAADMKNEALEELSASARYLRRGRDYRGRTMVADLLHRLGAHNLAFRVAILIAQDGGDLVSGEPYAWRAWRHAYPRAFETDVLSASKQHEVDDELILSIMRTESHFRPWVRSRVGARGLMQLMPNTAKRIGRIAKGGRSHAARYKNPRSNVWLGTWYLGNLLERYDANLGMAAGAYNAGPSAMDDWVKRFQGMPFDEFVERIPYRETRRYTRRVLETYMVYRLLKGEKPFKLANVVKAIDPPEGSVRF